MLVSGKGKKPGSSGSVCKICAEIKPSKNLAKGRNFTDLEDPGMKSRYCLVEIVDLFTLAGGRCVFMHDVPLSIQGCRDSQCLPEMVE